MNDNYSGQTSIYAGLTEPATSLLETFIAAMPSNSWAEYTGTNINEFSTQPVSGNQVSVLETEQNMPLTNWANKWTWHPERKLISGVGTTQGYNVAGGQAYGKQVLFNLSSNLFSVAFNPANIANPYGHIYDSNCSGFVNNRTWFKPYNRDRLVEYNAASAQWIDSDYTVASLSNKRDIFAVECSAAHDALYVLERDIGRLAKFDLATNQLSVIGNYSGVGNYPFIVSLGDQVVFGAGTIAQGGASIYKIDTAGAVSLITSTLPAEYAANGNSKMLPHPTDTTKLVLMSYADKKIRMLDIVSGQFDIIAGDITTEPFFGQAPAISLIGLGAIAFLRGGGRTAGVTTSKFWIYKV